MKSCLFETDTALSPRKSHLARMVRSVLLTFDMLMVNGACVGVNQMHSRWCIDARDTKF